MSTYNVRVGEPDGVAIGNYGTKIAVVKITVDFAAIPRATGSVLQLLDLPAGSRVLEILSEVETPEGGVLTADIGDTDADGYFNDLDLNAAAGTLVSSIVAGAAIGATYGKTYTADDILTMTLTGNADAGKVNLYVAMLPLT